jgi:fatty-acid peroxygenase
MAVFPRAPGFDRTASLVRAPYTFIGSTCDRLGTDFFETRFFLKRTICLRGEEAAVLFYDDTRFERGGAAPGWLRHTSFGQGGVQGLDGAAHRARRTLQLSLLETESLTRIRRLLADEWISSLPWWEVQRKMVLYPELHTILTRVACAWTGVPLPEVDVNRRTRDLVALFDAAGNWRHIQARLARRRVDSWLRQVIVAVRAGGGAEPHSALERLSRSKLDLATAAVELCNLIRPVVALSVYIVFIALALHDYPQKTPRREEERLGFVQEVRRFYPFFPPVMARVRQDFEWRGMRFPAGRRTLLDLHGTNHHEVPWSAPNEFRPERFAVSTPNPYAFVSQGGGRRDGHRCAGEELSLVLLDEALLQLLECMHYSVPPQDLRVDMQRVPALPYSRMVLDGVRARAPTVPLGRRHTDASQVIERLHRRQA